MTDRPPPAGRDSAASRRLAGWLLLIGLGSAALYAATYVPLTAHRGPPPVELRLVMYPLLFGLYFIAAFLVWRQREWAATRRVTVIVLAGAVLYRGLALTGPVARNNDNRRYLWEGRVLLEGMNPYAAPPAGPVYDGLRRELAEAGDSLYEDLAPSLNTVRSVYGPLATGLFVLPHWLPFDRIWTLRLMMALFDMGTVLVIARLLAGLGRAPGLALIYAWNPVCMSSFPDRAHIDAVMVFLIAVAVWLIDTDRWGWGGLVFGAALLVKVSPLYLALPMIRVGRTRFAAPLAIIGALGLIPFALAGEGSLSGFREFGSRWHNTDSIYGLLLLVLQPLKGLIDASAMARSLVFVAAPAYALWRTCQGDPARRQWLFEACAAIAAAGLLLSPAVHPWYTTHMLVFLCFAPSSGLLLLTCATMAWFLHFWRPGEGSVVAGLVSAVDRYYEPWRWVAYPPVYALLVWTWLRRRENGASRGPSNPAAGPS
jgi:hypothetical protein